MFGRVGRAAQTISAKEPVIAAAVLAGYSPEAIASALAVGMGTAGVGSGAAMARRPDGTQVSAMAEAVTGAMTWGRREQRRYLRLPGHVLVMATPDAVILREWTPVSGMGPELARWSRGTFSASGVRYVGKVGVRVILASGKIAVLSGTNGPLHRKTRATAQAIIPLRSRLLRRASRGIRHQSTGRSRMDMPMCACQASDRVAAGISPA